MLHISIKLVFGFILCSAYSYSLNHEDEPQDVAIDYGKSALNRSPRDINEKDHHDQVESDIQLRKQHDLVHSKTDELAAALQRINEVCDKDDICKLRNYLFYIDSIKKILDRFEEKDTIKDDKILLEIKNVLNSIDKKDNNTLLRAANLLQSSSVQNINKLRMGVAWGSLKIMFGK
ncbi:uncharacterized protein LOC142975289 [Anticarsia gemmatalis]|uniref:uncharacterized protein LOC142975289 n=1 Tax=Anticarsia gemmatalis TaxID=129554 RepID=UPI003F758350